MLAPLISAFLSIALGTTATPAFAQSQSGVTIQAIEAASTPLSLWEPQQGDSFVVDTRENMGYLVHENGSFTAFPVVTGQRRVVRYIGRTYNASTPNQVWNVKSTHIKGDRMTYGKTGRFMRLFDEDGLTAYGIHGYGNEEEMFGRDSRYGSMGCVIVRERILDIIERTYGLNENALTVITTYGLNDLPLHIAANNVVEQEHTQ